MNGPLVSICCITYNHENYIRDAIEGFLIQKTNFPFEIIIHDDASTDGTALIIQDYASKYPNLIIPIFQSENQWSKGIRPSPTFVWPRARGKYIALCEGDDYWTDPYKLQKQVDFLEANPEYGMVAADVDLINEKGEGITANEMLLEQRRRCINEPTFFDLLNGNLVNTLTVVVRTDLVKTLAERVKKENLWYVVDYWFWLHVSTHYKIKILPEVLAAYRVHARGISRKNGILEPQVPWIRYDAVKYYMKETKRIPVTEKTQLFKVMAGIAFKTNVFSKLWLRTLYWIITHLVFLFLWSVSKFRRVDS